MLLDRYGEIRKKNLHDLLLNVQVHSKDEK